MQMKSEHLTVAILFYSTLLLLNMIYRNDMKVNQINYHVYIFVICYTTNGAQSAWDYITFRNK